jgi:hypothetical protein
LKEKYIENKPYDLSIVDFTPKYSVGGMEFRLPFYKTACGRYVTEGEAKLVYDPVTKLMDFVDDSNPSYWARLVGVENPLRGPM